MRSSTSGSPSMATIEPLRRRRLYAPPDYLAFA